MAKKKKKIHSDGYANAFLGQGLANRDPSAKYKFTKEEPLDDDEIDNLYTYNGIAKKIAETPADDAVSKGFTLKNGLNELPNSKDVLSTMEDIDWQKTFSEALAWDRAYGGSAILLMVNDGRSLSEPLNLRAADKIDHMEVYSHRDIYHTGMYYTDPSNPLYGTPSMYTIINPYGSSMDVDASRLLVFTGGRLSNDMRRERDGWGASCFDMVQAKLMQYETSLSLSLMALSRLSQSVLKLDGLADVLSADGGETLVRKRLQLIDMARHMLNTIAVDAADDYQQFSMPISGITTIIEEFEVALSAACNIPVTILYGRSPSGLNATGESDFEQYYKMVGNIQTRSLKPRLIKLINIMNDLYGWKLPNKYTIEFNPLWSMSEAEQADVKQKVISTAATKVNAVNSLVQSGVITTDEARKILQDIINKREVQ